MKLNPCEKYRELIERYSENAAISEATDELTEHIKQCAGCRAYLEALSKTDKTITDWVASLEPLIENGTAEAIRRFHQLPEPQTRITAGSNRWRWLGYAAAACVLIVSGFLAGRGQGSSVGAEELAQMQNRITASVVDTLRPEIVGEYAKMQNALSDQITLQLTDYAEQTVLRNDLQTYSLLTQLIEAIQAAQARNQQWALSAMQELEAQRLQDQQQVRSELAAFAAYTGSELQRTRQELESLSSKQ